MKSLKDNLAPRSKCRGNTWIPIIVVVVLTPLLTILMWQFYLKPQMDKQLGISGHGGGHETHADHGEHGGGDHGGGDHGDGHHGHKKIMGVVANLAGEHRTRFIKVSYELEGSHKDFEDKIGSSESKIRHSTSSYLSGLTLAQINNNPKMQDLASKELKEELNKIPGIDGMVEGLYFLEFNIQ